MKSIKRNFVYSILLKVSAVIFPLITAPYIARILEPDGVGLASFAGTYAGYFALVAVLGIPKYGIRLTSSHRDNNEQLSKDVSELLSVSVIVTIVVTIIYLLSITIIGKLNENYLLFLIAGIVVYLAPFNVEWFFSGIEEYGFITLRSVIIRTLSVVALFIFVKSKSDLAIYLIINAAATVITDVWNFVRMIKMGVIPRFTLEGLKP